jgi:type IV pilus assembly protein PilA
MTPIRDQRGFTLLEILIVLSIISILSVIAIPVYLNYDVRAKISEGFVLADPVQNMVAEYYQTWAKWPSSNQTAGVQDPSSFKTDNVDSISVAQSGTDVAITITYRIPALGTNNTIILTSTIGAGNSIQWSCTQGTVIEKYRPQNCRA